MGQAEEVGQEISPRLDILPLEVVSQCPQTFTSLQSKCEIKMEHQQFSEMEMPTQSSPNHSHHQASQHYHHHQQQPNSQVSAGSSGTTRMSSQSANINVSNSMNPNSLTADLKSNNQA